MANVLLEAKNISIKFGGLKAVDNLNFQIHEGELIGLIGPNGAGKTTAFNMITGVYKPTEGSLFVDGQNYTGKKPYEISKLGITRTFQNIRLFGNLTVLENVMIAQHQSVKYSLASAFLQTKKFKNQEKEMTDKALNLLKIFKLDNKAQEPANSLPYGEQRKLEIVRALATNPKIILLDEPAAGMNHSETKELMDTISQIRKDFKLTVLLIEHDMKFVMGICERILVLDHGVKIEDGNPEKVRTSQKVIEAYLGVDQES